MCFDPVSMAMAAVGSGVSAYGRKRQMADEQSRTDAVVSARNAELARQRGLIDLLAGENAADMSGLLGRLQTDPTAAQGARTAFLTQGMAPLDEAPIPLSENAPQVAKAEYAKRAREAFAESKSRADAQGRLGGFGDILFGNALQAGRTAGDIDLRNSFARSRAQMLPSMQTLASLEATRAPDMTGQMLQAAGRMMGQMGGSGFGQSIFGGAGGPQQIARGMGGNAGMPMGPSYLTGVY